MTQDRSAGERAASAYNRFMKVSFFLFFSSKVHFPTFWFMTHEPLSARPQHSVRVTRMTKSLPACLPVVGLRTRTPRSASLRASLRASRLLLTTRSAARRGTRYLPSGSMPITRAFCEAAAGTCTRRLDERA